MYEETLKEPIILSDERIETLETLKPLTLPVKKHIKPKLFLPKKNLNLEKFQQILKKLELFEFTRIEFDPVIRIDYLQDLVSNYDPRKKCSYVCGFKINVTENDLARALKLPVTIPKKASAKSQNEVSEVYSDEEIGFIEDFVFNWMLVSEEEMVTPSEIVDWVRCIRDGHPEKMDAAKLIWYKVEKELTQGEKLVECYYASHLQCLIRSQRPFLFFDYDDYVGKEVAIVEDGIIMSLNMSDENKGLARAIEKITGEDGLLKTRCNICNKVYCQLPRSGTSSMRKHLCTCYPQFITQVEPLEPVSHTDTVMSLSSDELSNKARAAKRLKFSLMENVGNKTDEELLDFIRMNKQNVGILEQNLPEIAVATEEAIKCHEAEIERRARLQRPKTYLLDYELLTPYQNVGDNMVEDVGGEITKTHEDVNQDKTRPQVDKIKLVIKAEEGEPSVPQNESIDEIIAEEERAGTLHSVPANGDKNPASTQDICAELKKVSSVLSMLSSPNKFYIPQGDPLDEEAEKAKQTLIELLDKNFETIVGSPDEEKVKSCIKILTKNLHKLPMFQGRVIETLNTEFDSACQNWEMCHTNHQVCIAFDVQLGDKLEVLKDWQEKDMDVESKIGTVDADILRLKAELHKKELTRKSLVKEKSDLFSQSNMSIDEAEKLLQDVVTAKLQSNVAVRNMNELAAKWERIRENFKMNQV